MIHKKQHEEVIRKSNLRSESFGIEKDMIFSKRILNPSEKQTIIKRNEELLTIAKPHIDNLSEIVAGTGFILILTDNEGCILEINGDEETINAASELNMIVGAYMDEKSVGTNAMGIALTEDAPIQVSAKEHFITAYHKWTCSAAPIHDTEGNIMGTLNLTASREKVHPHTLGMVIAIVKAIEKWIENRSTQTKLYNTYQYVFTIMNTLYFGVIAVDMLGRIEWINDSACNIFNIKRSNLINTHVYKIIKNWNVILNKISKDKKIIDEEFIFEFSDKEKIFNLSAYGINNPKTGLTGILITFREMQKVLSMVNKYIGMDARYTFDDIIGDAPIMKQLKEYAKAIAVSPSTVLITGESGTGKELFAQAIHNASNRSENGFVAVNCGAISESLIESELFGYEEGAFTGAKKKGKKGKFELADGGTLFLDEIGEMNIDMQVKLLRALQESKIVRVGGEKEITVDVRIIAATNKNLLKMIDEGKFRLDLFYRLNVLPLEIPALRQRAQDIPHLVRYFLSRKAAKLNKPVPKVSEELMNELQKYEWMGNIRELENYVEKFINFGGDNTFMLPNLKNDKILHTTDVKEKSLPSLDEIEKKAIEDTLSYTKNNISHTADILGITRTTLYKKIKKYNIL